MRTVTTFFVLALAVAAPQALAAPTLNAMRKCPATGPLSACAQVAFFSATAGESYTGPSGWQSFVKIWGRLDDGAQIEYLVKTYDQREQTERTPFPRPNAYLGRSRANNPLILTDQGVLEITSPGYDLPETKYVLVDAVEWKIVARYLKTGDNSYIFTSHRPAGVWDAARRVCISAPLRNPGRLVRDATLCAARPARKLREEEVDGVFGNLAPEAVELGRIKRLVPDFVTEGMGALNRSADTHHSEDTGVKIFRIKGTRQLLLVSYYIDNC
jgi:hypothetical protein